jgi:DNA helicase-2/ATP-dependent DNA helicase PcrA
MDLSIFNENQREAVLAPHDFNEIQKILIIAGAGSGKTRVLTHRIAYLTEECKVNPAQITAVTFSRKAAKEMSERLGNLVGRRTVSLINTGTFHGLSADILRQFWRSRFVILDDYDQTKMCKDLVKENPELSEIKIKDFKSWLSFQRSKCYNPLKGNITDSTMVDNFRQLTKLYFDRKAKLDNLDFDDLLEKAVVLLKTNEAARRRCQAQSRFLLVDEYQDTNNRQFEFLKLLSSEKTQMLMVGDEDQLIYSWRGAEIKHILASFEEVGKKDKQMLVVLNQNYRSTGNIVRVADTLVKPNIQRVGKHMEPSSEAGEKVKLGLFYSDSEEGEYIVDRIEKWRRDGIEHSDICILYRMNRISRSLEKALINASIPYEIHGGVALFDSREIKLCMSILMFAYNPHNVLFLSIVTDFIKIGVGASKLQSLRGVSEMEGITVLEAMKRDKISTKPKVADFIEHMSYLEAEIEAKEMGLLPLAHYVVDNFNPLSCFKAEEHEKRENNLNLWLQVIESYEMDCARKEKLASIDGFQEERLLNDTLGDEDTTGKVQLMTIHKSKGLEFEAGFIVGMQDGIFPVNIEEFDSDGEEDRRLAFVGITRFKRECEITRCSFRAGFDSSNRFRGASSILDGFVTKMKNQGILEVISEDGGYY